MIAMQQAIRGTLDENKLFKKPSFIKRNDHMFLQELVLEANSRVNQVGLVSKKNKFLNLHGTRPHASTVYEHIGWGPKIKRLSGLFSSQ